jgi:hypothetical protein
MTLRGAAALLCAWLLVTPDALGGQGWTIERLAGGDLRPALANEPGREAPGGLPDGRVATLDGGDVVEAWYGEPTRRYGHAVLGDALEAGALIARTADGSLLTLRLPGSEVFEDRTPRLADLDGDGSVEIVTIRSSLTGGASVTVYGAVDGRLRERATNGFIGRAHRWLNIAGIADFDGRPGQEIAFVRTPHIGGTLFFYRFRNDALQRVAAIEGFSNHVIGAREMRLSAVTDLDADGRVELTLPSADRAALRVIEISNGRAAQGTAIPLPARIDKAIVVEGTGPSTTIFLGLDDGGVYRLMQSE